MNFHECEKCGHKLSSNKSMHIETPFLNNDSNSPRMLIPILRLICGAADVGGVNLVFSRALRTLFACEMTWNEKSLSAPGYGSMKCERGKCSAALANKVSRCDPCIHTYYWWERARSQKKSRMSVCARPPEKVKWVTRAEAAAAPHALPLCHGQCGKIQTNLCSHL